jgi:mono/diheme cytochrome c family protein
MQLPRFKPERLRWMFYGMIVTVCAAAAGAAALLYSGIYNVAATSEHTRLVYFALEDGMRASVRRRVEDMRVPADLDEAALLQGAHCFHTNCVQCHGAPGVAPASFSKGLLPTAKNLTQTARDWPIEHVYWTTRHGIRMTAMPAWEYRLGDRELWSIAAFVDRELPYLTAQQYQDRITAAAGERCDVPATRMAPDARRGLRTLRQYGCQGCHRIPDVTGPDVHVGPSLHGFTRRPLIASALPNTRDNVVRWLMDPKSVRPRTLMPDLGVTEQHAQDIHAYLATLD